MTILVLIACLAQADNLSDEFQTIQKEYHEYVLESRRKRDEPVDRVDYDSIPRVRRTYNLATEFFSDPDVLKLCELIENNHMHEIQGFLHPFPTERRKEICNTVGKHNMTPLAWAIHPLTGAAFKQMVNEGCNADVPLKCIFSTDRTISSKVVSYDQTVREFITRKGTDDEFDFFFKFNKPEQISHHCIDVAIGAWDSLGEEEVIRRLRFFLDNGYSPEGGTRPGAPLLNACRFSQLGIARTLLEKGANPHAYGSRQMQSFDYLGRAYCAMREKMMNPEDYFVPDPRYEVRLRHLLTKLHEEYGYDLGIYRKEAACYKQSMKGVPFRFWRMKRRANLGLDRPDGTRNDTRLCLKALEGWVPDQEKVERP